ncbi:MAG: hypothetical protein NC205_00805 [Prevotella sp.]|nr:hypothetical protein [Alistipes senegalensis]MCM1357102.1 hypothetical protein [Prevotella sp.]MCM1472576.1 hypothetical protein [Muribaculaceae bacterium]
MAVPVPLNTGLTSEQVLEAFRRALNDLTDEQINAKFAEIEAKITAIENKLTEVEENE